MNRPFSAFSVLLGFLALTMFAVSSTTRSTTVKPTNGYADRAAIRRQAALSRLSAVVTATDTAGEIESFDEEWLCIPGSIDDGLQTSSYQPNDQSQPLRGPTTMRLTPVVVEVARNELASPAQPDTQTYYDSVYDRTVLGIADAKVPAPDVTSTDLRQELSALEIATLFQTILPQKSDGTRNATRKSQRRAGLQLDRLPFSTILPALNNWLAQQALRLSSDSTPSASLNWSDYADLIDRATGKPATSAVAVRISDAN